MCGLAGAMSSSLTNVELDMFKDLLNVASLRGAQGSGVAVVANHYTRGPSIQTLRTKHIAGSLAYSAELNELFQARVCAVIGHARFPTKGGLEEKAVHPHRVGHITGVHNGTMHRVAGQDVKDQSDSAMLFKAIAEVGIEEAIKESSGAYALVWADEKEGTLNFLKNVARPLFFKNIGWGDKNINTLFWSSEQEMLDFIFKRSHRQNNTWDTYLPNDTLFKYPLDVNHLIRPVEVKKDVRPTPPRPVVYQGHGHGHGRDNPTIWDYDENGEYRQRPLLRGRSRGGYGGGQNGSVRRDDMTSGDDLPWAGVQRTLRLPPPDVERMSKSERKKYEKELKKEEQQALNRLANFRREREIEEKHKAREKAEKDIRPALAELVDSSDDVTALRNVTNLGAADGYRDSTLGGAKRMLPLVGRVCCWCDHRAEVGDTVFLANNDLGCKDFICHDCGTGSDAAGAYCADARMAIVCN